MRAIVVAAFAASEKTSPMKSQPRAMRLLMDRPVVQHLVEMLVEQGVSKFDFILHEHPQVLREFLGSGERWGSHFQFHLVKDPGHPYRALRQLSQDDVSAGIILARADTLPAFSPGELTGAAESAELVLFSRTESIDDWCGWALMRGTALADLLEAKDFTEQLSALATGCVACRPVAEILSVATWNDCLAANVRLLERPFPGIAGTGTQSDDGIYLGWNVRIHPSARLHPPIYLGDRVKIESGTNIGPNVVVSQDCLVGAGSTLKDTLVCPRSYIGEYLELDSCVVDHNWLTNLRLNTTVALTDHFLLGDISEPVLTSALRTFGSRLFAFLLLLAFLPVLTFVYLYRRVARPGPVMHEREVIRLPAAELEGSWQTFRLQSFASEEELAGKGPWADLLLRFLPGLINVMKGDLLIVGMPVRSYEEILALDPDWQHLYLEKFAGLIREADLYQGPAASNDDHYVAEAYYAAKSCFRHDVGLIKGYLARLWRRGE